MPYCLLVLCLLLPAELAAQSYRVAQCKVLKVAGPDQWSTNSTFDPSSQSSKGLGYALLQKIAEKQQIPYKILPNLPWQRVLKYAEDGQLDIIVSIYKNAQRERYLEFSEPVFTNNVKIYVRKGNEFTFRSFADLSGKKGLIPTGGTYGDEFENYAKNLDLEGKTTIADLFVYLSRGAADYAIQNENRATAYISEMGLENEIVPLASPLLSVSARLGYSRNSNCNDLLQKFKHEFQQMSQSGELAQIRSSYFKQTE